MLAYYPPSTYSPQYVSNSPAYNPPPTYAPQYVSNSPAYYPPPTKDINDDVSLWLLLH